MPVDSIIDWLGELEVDDLRWMAEPLPAQHGRETLLVWGNGVRVLVDIDDGDLTVHGVGLTPGRRSRHRLA